METKLRHPYPGIARGRSCSVGGSQRWLKSSALQRCGCGVVAALDVIRYLCLCRPGFKTDFFTGVEDTGALPLPVYDLCVQRMRSSYVPVLYPIGTNGFALAAGLNLYFRRCGLPLQARWGVSKDRLWAEIRRQLAEDLPVILSIGNRFPKLWEKRGAALYRKGADESLREAAHAKAHFVTVLGMDEQWLRISSWGQEYYISRADFQRYRDTASMPLLCNMVLLKPKND